MNSRQEHKLDGSKDKIIMSTESEDSSLTKKYHHQIAEKALGIVFYLDNLVIQYVIDDF